MTVEIDDMSFKEAQIFDWIRKSIESDVLSTERLKNEIQRRRKMLENNYNKEKERLNQYEGMVKNIERGKYKKEA